ncbi:sensor domain-containing diguanylate cyclase [Aestuariibacter salexigens]|uniref:sensor domain-containing diguanylate cyclase n=1 Tax=Aestuariibacter salexigens TaxID=226010 RepID=UPI000416A8BC|nr:diguanylate cyclase [Aestuariibacter salexigens]
MKLPSSKDASPYWLLLTVGLAALVFFVSLTVMGERQINPMQIFDVDMVQEQQAMTLSDVMGLPGSRWQDTEADLSFGMNDNAHWFRFTLPNLKKEQHILEVGYSLLDSVSVWFVSDGDILTQYHSGDAQPFYERMIPHEKFLFPVPQNHSSVDVYLRVKTSGTLRVPLFLWTETDLLVDSSEHNLIVGIFFGYMLAMALSNLFFFVTTRRVSFIVYCGYVASLGLTLAVLHGLAFKYLWPEAIWLQGKAVAIFANLVIMFAIIFTYHLLQLKEVSPLIYRGMRYLLGVFALNLLVALVIPYSIQIKLFMVLLLLAVSIIFGVGLWLSLRGLVMARYFTLAWSILLASGFIAALENSNIIDLAIPSQYLLMIGASIETLLLALVLAMSYSQQRDELFATQEQALAQEKAARVAKERLYEVEQSARDELEYKVQERTLELEIALRELSEANRELERKNTLDPLTGINNRRFMDKRLQAETRRSRREQTSLSLVMLDIDHFKPINDNYGHQVGDECIKYVASLLKENLKRNSDVACRYGGEEFALILPNTDLEGAVAVAENIRMALQARPVNVDDVIINLTLSAGVASCVIQFEGQEQSLLRVADQCLYQAKQHGRNRVVADRIQDPKDKQENQ